MKPLVLYHANCADGFGGHKNAAGFEMGIQTLLEWIK